jgi:O-antigen/teichoic acid export membrane protein
VSSLSRVTASAMKWGGVSQIGRQILQIVTLVVLARLLSPADFGLVSMAAVFVGLIAIFKDLGVASAIVQRDQLTQRLLSTVFWVTVALGFLSSVVMVMIAPLVGDIYRQPEVTPVLRVLSIAFIVSGVTVLQQALLERRLQMRRLAILELVSAVAGSILAVVLAFLGAGVWSLVAMTLMTAAVNSILLWKACDWQPSRTFSRVDFRSVLSFSLNLTGFNIINYVVRNADNLLVGRYLGSGPLGFYSMAYRILLFPLTNISSVTGRVMFPVYSRISSDFERFRRGYLLAARAIALVTFPLMCGVFALRTPFVLAVFGEKWQPLIPLIAILAPVGLIQSVATTTGSIFMATGRTRLQFLYGLVTGVLAVAAFIIGLKWGVNGVAAAYAVFVLIVTYPSFAIPFRLIELRFGTFLHSLRTITVASVIMLAALIGCAHLASGRIGPFVTLLVLVPLGAGVYAAVLRLIDPSPAREVLAALRSRPQEGDAIGD